MITKVISKGYSQNGFGNKILSEFGLKSTTNYNMSSGFPEKVNKLSVILRAEDMLFVYLYA